MQTTAGSMCAVLHDVIGLTCIPTNRLQQNTKTWVLQNYNKGRCVLSMLEVFGLTRPPILRGRHFRTLNMSHKFVNLSKEMLQPPIFANVGYII